jgi:tetratricopeptide (TPR) repeat protein
LALDQDGLDALRSEVLATAHRPEVKLSGSVVTLNVFFASPGGLKDEREAFRDIVDEVNKNYAVEQGVMFVPKGWEYALPGMGRAQEIINEQVRESDYLVVMFFDKWGRPPGGAGGYTSGTEEEFNVGKECLHDPAGSMRYIAVYFKGVSERQMADPGPELQKVLTFKSGLEEEGLLLYSTFDSLEEFKTAFRARLHGWARVWRDGPPAPKQPEPAEQALPDDAVATSINAHLINGDESSSEASIVDQAVHAFKRGRLTRAEQLFAQVVTDTIYNEEAYTEYVRFLRKTGRLSLAKSTCETFLVLAQDADDLRGEIEALANLGILERQLGANKASLTYLDRAMAVVDELIEAEGHVGDGEGLKRALSTKAFLLDNLSLTLRRLPDRMPEAFARLEEAREIQAQTGDIRGAAFTWRNTGTLHYRQGEMSDAEADLLRAIELFASVEYRPGQSAALGSLAEVHEATGHYAKAIETLEHSIALNDHRNPDRVAMNYSTLVRVHLKAGDVDQARRYARLCSGIGKELNTPESIASGQHCEGQVAIAEGNYSLARSALSDSLAGFRAAENPVGVAAVLLDFARIDAAEGLASDAQKKIAVARDTLGSVPHFGLMAEAAALEFEINN